MSHADKCLLNTGWLAVAKDDSQWFARMGRWLIPASMCQPLEVVDMRLREAILEGLMAASLQAIIPVTQIHTLGLLWLLTAEQGEQISRGWRWAAWCVHHRQNLTAILHAKNFDLQSIFALLKVCNLRDAEF